MKTLALAFIPAALLAGAAQAGEPEPTQTVEYKRTDLLTQDGQARIEAQLRDAAGEVCQSPHGHPPSARMRAAEIRCEARALDGAMEQLESRIAELEQERRLRLARRDN